MHPGYVAPGAVLIASFLVYELTQSGGAKPGEKFVTTESLRMNALWHAAHGQTS